MIPVSPVSVGRRELKPSHTGLEVCGGYSHCFRRVGGAGKGKLQLGSWVSVVSLLYYGKLKHTSRVGRSRKV